MAENVLSTSDKRSVQVFSSPLASKTHFWSTINLSTYFRFSDFEFKIRLGLSFHKQKIAIFKLTIYWFSVRSHNHYTKQPTVSASHRKAFSKLQSCLTDSSWIHPILLIKLIQYKIGKTWLSTMLNLYSCLKSNKSKRFYSKMLLHRFKCV